MRRGALFLAPLPHTCRVAHTSFLAQAGGRKRGQRAEPAADESLVDVARAALPSANDFHAFGDDAVLAIWHGLGGEGSISVDPAPWIEALSQVQAADARADLQARAVMGNGRDVAEAFGINEDVFAETLGYGDSAMGYGIGLYALVRKK